MGKNITRKTQSLKKRKEFVQVAREGKFYRTETIVLQAYLRLPDTRISGPRIGFTVTKKHGSAVIRNRIRRRLKETVRLLTSPCLLERVDYVFIARAEIQNAPFIRLQSDIQRALDKVHSRLEERAPTIHDSHTQPSE